MEISQQVKELIFSQLNNVQQGYIRVFLIVTDFTPLYFDIQETDTKQNVLFKANQAFYSTQDIIAPLYLKFNRYLKFQDSILIFADIYQVAHTKDKPVLRPLYAEPLGLTQQFGLECPIDSDDFSLYIGHQFPCALFPNQLIAYLTNPHFFDENSTQNMVCWASFLFYCQVWFNTESLLNKLIDRFNIPSPIKKISEDFPTYYYIQHQIPVKMRVLSLIKHWFEFYRDDFSTANILQLKTFLNGVEDQLYQNQKQSIMTLLEKPLPTITQPKFSFILKVVDKDDLSGKQHQPAIHLGRVHFPMFSLYLNRLAAPRSVLLSPIEYHYEESFSIAPSEKHFQFIQAENLQNCSTDAMTYTIYFFLYECYRNMHPREFIMRDSNKPDTLKNCPNINLHIKRTNIITNFVALSILKEQQKRRPMLYEKFVHVTSKLKEIKNYDAAMAVISALTWAPVERLQLQQQLKGPVQQKAAELRNLFGVGDNWKTIRKEIEATASDELCIPILSVCLQDIFKTEEAEERFKEGKCNMHRALISWRSVHSYLRFQAAEFKQMPFNENLYIELCEQKNVGEDDVWKISYAALPQNTQAQ